MLQKFYPVLKEIHSQWAYLVILMVFIITLITFIKYFQKARVDKTIRKISFFTMITVHLQLLFGIILYFISPMVIIGSSTMKISAHRFYAVEHPIAMIIAIILITVANAQLKRATHFRIKIPVFFLLGLVFISSRIPYKVWFM